jgi:hypothetical protein
MSLDHKIDFDIIRDAHVSLGASHGNPVNVSSIRPSFAAPSQTSRL